MAGGIELVTFGHGAATADEIGELLRGAGVRLVVDIRTAVDQSRLNLTMTTDPWPL